MKISKYLPIYIITLSLLTLFLRIVLVPYYDNSLGGIEPNVIYGIQRILQGQPLYQDPAAGTYAIIQYTPLYYYCAAGIAKLIHFNGSDVHTLYILCRILALLFNLLTVIVCALIIRTWRLSWLHSFVFALPVFICLTAHYYTRGDSMHLFFFTAAIYAYICCTKNKGVRPVLISSLCTAACIMTKQSGVLCAGIIGYCLLFRERRYLLTTLFTASTFIFSWLIASLCIGGDWYAFYQNTVLGLKNGVDYHFLYTIFTGRHFLDMVPCYIAGGIMVYLAVQKIADKTFRMLATGMLLSWMFAAITGLKVGSSSNYFTEFLVFVFTALPFLLKNEESKKVLFTLRGFGITASTFVYISLLIIITSKTMGLFTAVYIEKSIKNDSKEYANEKALYSYFINDLHIKKGEKIFFTERRFLDNIFFEYGILPTKDVVTQVYTTDSATFDYTALRAGMSSGMIKYIVVDKRRDDINICNNSLPFIVFDKRAFRPLAGISGYVVYMWSPVLSMSSL